MPLCFGVLVCIGALSHQILYVYLYIHGRVKYKAAFKEIPWSLPVETCQVAHCQSHC